MRANYTRRGSERRKSCGERWRETEGRTRQWTFTRRHSGCYSRCEVLHEQSQHQPVPLGQFVHQAVDGLQTGLWAARFWGKAGTDTHDNRTARLLTDGHPTHEIITMYSHIQFKCLRTENHRQAKSSMFSLSLYIARVSVNLCQIQVSVWCQTQVLIFSKIFKCESEAHLQDTAQNDDWASWYGTPQSQKSLPYKHRSWGLRLVSWLPSVAPTCMCVCFWPPTQTNWVTAGVTAAGAEPKTAYSCWYAQPSITHKSIFPHLSS